MVSNLGTCVNRFDYQYLFASGGGGGGEEQGGWRESKGGKKEGWGRERKKEMNGNRVA